MKLRKHKIVRKIKLLKPVDALIKKFNFGFMKTHSTSNLHSTTSQYFIDSLIVARLAIIN